MHTIQTTGRRPRTTPARNTIVDQPGASCKSKGDRGEYLRQLEQCSSRRGMNIYEYLAIPTFIRQGKIIKAG